MGSRVVRGSKGVGESEGVMGSKGVAVPSVMGWGVSASQYMKRGARQCVSQSVCVCVRNRSGAYISSVFGPIFAKLGLWVDQPLTSVIPRARLGPTWGGAGRGTGTKKTLFLVACKSLNLNISCVCLQIIPKPGVLLDIRRGAKHS